MSLLNLNVRAEDIWRLRYTIPQSDETEITQGSSKTSGQLNVSGHSGHLIFANGVGVGYSTIRK